jgi:hypothetical protein
MVYISAFEKQSDTRWKVKGVHYMPLDPNHGLGKTEAELAADGGVLVASVPEPEAIAGKLSELYYNPQTGALTYQYTDRPKTDKELLAQAQADNLTALEALAELYEMVLALQTPTT